MIAYHPSYKQQRLNKFRLVYSETETFLRRYLYQRHNEVQEAWNDRQKLAYNPAFAREAIDEFARALTQRSSEIKRVGGLALYHEAITGLKGGIDRRGSSLNAFLAEHVVGELMAMGSVGIFVDNDAEVPFYGETQPYIYAYRAEDILNWRYEGGKLVALLLRDHVEEMRDGFPVGLKEQYRKIYLAADHVAVSVEDEKGISIRQAILPLDRIPFVHLRLPYSLLKDTADYQIAMLNVASAGTYLVWAMNFPLYTEQFAGFEELSRNDEEDKRKKQVGAITGVKYPKGTERPGWISPPNGPLESTFKYLESLKVDIRQLTALAITNLPKMASAESKAEDRVGLESGLSMIGMVLQSGESELSAIWHEYKGSKKPAEIHYPEKYELLGEDERRKSAKEMQELQNAVPSPKFQKETAKIIAEILHGHRIPHDTLEAIKKEIDASPVPTADPEVLRSDHESGFVSDGTASVGRGYAPGEAAKAREDHAERLARIRMAQQADNPGARGDADADPNPGFSAEEEKKKSQDPDLDDRGKKKVKKS